MQINLSGWGIGACSMTSSSAGPSSTIFANRSRPLNGNVAFVQKAKDIEITDVFEIDNAAIDDHPKAVSCSPCE